MEPVIGTAVTDESAKGNGSSHVSHAKSKPVLTEEMLARVSSRAVNYDRENRFFKDDFEELKGAGYLLLAVPREFGRSGMTLAEVCREQRRLAYYAPATAL